MGLTGFRCRCGDLFCSEHRYSDRHECSYDYKTAGREAIGAAKEAGTAKLGELNLTRDAGANLVKKVMSGLGEAARSSGEAAVGTMRTPD